MFWSKKRFVENAYHRTLLDCEVMLDIDDTKFKKGKLEFHFKTIKAKSEHIFKELKKKGYHPVMYWTQNKSHHIGFVLSELLDCSEYRRKLAREKIIDEYCCDTMLASNHTIAIEGSKHYRSGKEKILIMS
jgi:hypothetical protein